MVRAELDDGQELLALNEIFVGHASHQSARYSLRYAGREETQSSSGLIVASGTGATGWALSISRATGVSVDLRPDEAAAVFLVREPWPSLATGASLISGRLEGTDGLLVVSRMNEGGVVFADGMEGDRLDFAWGRTLRISVARQRLRFVPGDGPPPAPRRPAPPPVALAPRRAGRIAPHARRGARTPAMRAVPAGRGPRWWRWRILMVTGVAFALLVYGWSRLTPGLPAEPVTPDWRTMPGLEAQRPAPSEKAPR